MPPPSNYSEKNSNYTLERIHDDHAHHDDDDKKRTS
tara:strand:- start:94 stop:201 length:108 start_codon:yes stop_codon:yes gene_type:complete